MAVLHLWSRVSVSSNPASDSVMTNNTVLNTPTTACAPTLYTLSNPDRADQEALGPHITDA